MCEYIYHTKQAGRRAYIGGGIVRQAVLLMLGVMCELHHAT